jgi:hypothetical protein
MLLLPHHYEFQETLADLPFFYKEMASQTSEVMHLIQGASGLPEMVDGKKLRDYLLSGQLDEQIEFVDAYAEESSNEWDISDVWLGSL